MPRARLLLMLLTLPQLTLPIPLLLLPWGCRRLRCRNAPPMLLPLLLPWGCRRLLLPAMGAAIVGKLGKYARVRADEPKSFLFAFVAPPARPGVPLKS